MGIFTVLLTIVAIGLSRPILAYDTSPVFSPDGQSLAFVRCDDLGKHPTILLLSLEDQKCRILAEGRSPKFNPDGKHLLYTVESPDKSASASWKKIGLSKHTDVYVISLEDSTSLKVTSQGGAFPTWSPDGGEIAYINAYGALCKLPLTGGNPKQIASKLPYYDKLTWLTDQKSFALIKHAKGKIAQYAFTPPSQTPVRISSEIAVPSEALSPTLISFGDKIAYLTLKTSSVDTVPQFGLDLKALSRSLKKTIATIPLDAPATALDLERFSICESPDGTSLAISCEGKIWLVEINTGNMTLITQPNTEPAPDGLSTITL